MAERAALSVAEVERLLDELLEAEFNRTRTDGLAESIVALPREDQEFVLEWLKRAVAAHVQIAYMFARNAPPALARTEKRVIAAWVLNAMDALDRVGLQAALKIMRDVQEFARPRHERASGVVLEDVAGILLTFVRGLSGRKLKLEQGEAAWTDSETLFLPAVVAEFEAYEDNFALCKSQVAMLWAQTRYGSFRPDLVAELTAYAEPGRALRCFQALENLRLEACIARELPGLAREMRRLKEALGEDALPAGWDGYAAQLRRAEATVRDSLRLLAQAYTGPIPAFVCYQGQLRPDEVAARAAERVAKEKARLRVKLAELARQEEEPQQRTQTQPAGRRFSLQAKDEHEGLADFELVLDDVPVAPPEDVRQLLTSIQLDLGEIPPEYLVAAGPGEYDPSFYGEASRDPDEVWQGTYHEEGALFYPEWDFGRQHYRKAWCVMRERDVAPVYDGFVPDVLHKYGGLVRRLRRNFEAIRDEDRLLKRQAQGDNVDIDALVEATAEARLGREMSERLYMRMHRSERDIAVAFMVDMSGSTKGWINDAEREALLLLAEALEALGDRYAIYGFSGMTRKRCELFRIKRFDEPYGEAVRARISGIRPQDYTRMGFAVRHLTGVLKDVEARTRLLVTLSDGKPDDYHDNYRGKYGIEDTRRALQEAIRAGIHPFCITIDEAGHEYLPHLYGAAHYVVIDDVRQLPLKVGGIYRRLTT
ncbi:MAG TPA: VWA domain-containing protein [Rhodocyclaceae bacterium]|nr:VWA domain-containing protein [Rhodocyclaceae bacterium]